MKKILACPELEEDAQEFRCKEWRMKQWVSEEQIDKDIVRTKHLKGNFNLHEDVKRIIEFYCHQKNVAYCQGMLEVLLPFIYMKQQTL